MSVVCPKCLNMYLTTLNSKWSLILTAKEIFNKRRKKNHRVPEFIVSNQSEARSELRRSEIDQPMPNP